MLGWAPCDRLLPCRRPLCLVPSARNDDRFRRSQGHCVGRLRTPCNLGGEREGDARTSGTSPLLADAYCSFSLSKGGHELGREITVFQCTGPNFPIVDKQDLSTRACINNTFSRGIGSVDTRRCHPTWLQLLHRRRSGCRLCRLLLHRRASPCAGNSASDEMVRVGPLCVDKYEASVWDLSRGQGNRSPPAVEPALPEFVSKDRQLDEALVRGIREGRLPLDFHHLVPGATGLCTFQASVC